MGQGQTPCWGSVEQSSIEAESFFHFHTKEKPKDKDLNETM